MKNYKNIILISIFFFFLPVNGAAKEKITWLIAHWPPYMELDKSRQTIVGGESGLQLKMLQNSLKDYEHMNREMPWNRFYFLVKKGETVCNSMAAKNTKREAFAQFSVPISISLPNQIVMRKETIAQLGFPKSLSLVELMQDPRFKGLLIKGRSYSREIDTLLEAYEKESNITRDIIDEQTSLKMLAKSRMDYILEFPFVITNIIKTYLPDLEGEFGAVPITGISPYEYIYVVCPKNEWGKELIKKINLSLKELHKTVPFRNTLEASYSGENLKFILGLYDSLLVGDQ